MAGFLSHLVQRTVAASPAMLPRLAGPYEGSRDVAVTRAGVGDEEAIAALDLARERAGPQLEPPVGQGVPWEGSAREPFASGSRDLPTNKHYQLEDPKVPAYANSPAVTDRRDVAVTRAGDGGEEAITALDLARERAGSQLEPPVGQRASLEGSAREPFASGSLDPFTNAHLQPEDPLVPTYADNPAVPDQRDLTLALQADEAALANAKPPVQVPQVQTPFLDSDASTARRPRTNTEATEGVEPRQSPSPLVSTRWPVEVPPRRPPALRNDDPTTTPGDAHTPLNGGDLARRHLIEPPGALRFEPMDRGNGHVAEDNASRSSIVPSVDPSPAIQTVRPKQGMLVEPQTPRASTQQHKGGDAQPRLSPQPVVAPTVHVTIGRIELRASAPTASPAPSRPTANRPALSLADYLERRAKAGAP